MAGTEQYSRCRLLGHRRLVGDAIAALHRKSGVASSIALQGIWNPAWQTLSATAVAIFGGIAGLLRGPANAIIDIINRIIGAWNSLEFRIGGQTIFGGTPLEVRLPGVSFGTPDIPTIPRLQSGAFVQRGGLAILDQGERVQSATVARGGGGGVTINVNFNRTVSNERDLETQVTSIVNTALATGEIAV